MRTSFFAFTSFIVVSLIAVTGCSASTQSARSTVDTSSDPSYTPPGSMNIAISDSSRTTAQQGGGGQQANAAEAMPQPNKNQIQKKSIRAAAAMY